MEKEDLENLIRRKEKEIKDLMNFKSWLGNKQLDKQIDLRLEDLAKLYKQRNK